MRYKVLYILLLGFLSLSCVQNAVPEPRLGGEIVTVPLFVSIDDHDGTKNGTDVVEDRIYNLWVIQFNGTSGSSKVLGEPVYVSDYENFDGMVKLVATEAPCAICLIANTFEGPGVFDINARSTLDDLKNLRRVIARESELLGGSCTMFNSLMEVDKVVAGQPLAVVLKRNVSKVSVSVSLSGEAVSEYKMNVTSLQFCSVPSVSYYVTNRDDLPDLFPSGQTSSRLNYPVTGWEDDDGDGTVSLKAYFPVNMRGTGPQGTPESQKNKFAPDGSTYFLVSASYEEEGHQKSVVYKFYLGEDMFSDYNLKPNYSYEYTFKISTIGDPATDYRVTDWGEVDFTDVVKYPLSNSYILNPTPVEGAWRYFKIPLEKADIFWGGEHGYGDKNTSYTLNNNSWEAFVLASDFVLNDDNFKITRSSGTKDDGYFEVAVRSGVQGNVIVAAGTKAPAVSWSWHLWITDYDPYAAAGLDSADGQYIYPVTGGAVHRYVDYGKNQTFWTSNDQTYIMDRNLGAVASGTYQEDGAGFLYYQFGRKDPFFAAGNYVYPQDKSTARAVRVSYETANGGGNGVQYSVLNPLSYINADAKDRGWMSDEYYNPSTSNKNILWNDPTTLPGGENEGGKSMFDPCPPGYCLPPSDVFSDFAYNNQSHPTTNITKLSKESDPDVPLVRGFEFLAAVKGLQYWPFAETDIPEQVLFFPATGHYAETASGTALSVANNGSWVSLWTRTPASVNSGSRLFARKGHCDPASSISRARAFPVRCITDNQSFK